MVLYFLFHFFFWWEGAMPHLWDVSGMACRMLVPRLGIEPRPSAVKAQSPKHLASREFSISNSNCSFVVCVRAVPIYLLLTLCAVILLYSQFFCWFFRTFYINSDSVSEQIQFYFFFLCIVFISLCCAVLVHFSHVRLFVTLWTCQAPLFMGIL